MKHKDVIVLIIFIHLFNAFCLELLFFSLPKRLSIIKILLKLWFQEIECILSLYRNYIHLPGLFSEWILMLKRCFTHQPFISLLRFSSLTFSLCHPSSLPSSQSKSIHNLKKEPAIIKLPFSVTIFEIIDINSSFDIWKRPWKFGTWPNEILFV